MKEVRILRLALLRRLLPCLAFLVLVLLPLLLITKPILSTQPLNLFDVYQWLHTILPHVLLVAGIVWLYSFLSFFSTQAHCGGLTISTSSLPQLCERLIVSVLTSVSLVIVLQRFYGVGGAWTAWDCQSCIGVMLGLAWWFFQHKPCQNIVMDTSRPLSCQIITVLKKSIWHVGGKISLLVVLILAALKLLAAGFHRLVVTEGVLRNTYPFVFNLSRTCNTHILNYASIQQAVVFTFVFVTAVDFVQHCIALAVFHPLDFTKLQLQDVLHEKYPGEQFLIRSLRFLHSAKASITLVQPSSKSKVFLGGSADNTPLYKKNIQHILSYMDTETVKGRKQIALGQFPVLSYYVGDNTQVVGHVDTNYALLLRCLAFHDLNRVARIQPKRRQELFEKHWNDVFDVCITNVASFVVQLQLLQVYMKEPKSHFKQDSSDANNAAAAAGRVDPSSVGQKKNEPITFEQLQALRQQLQSGIRGGAGSSNLVPSQRLPSRDPLEVFFEEQIYARGLNFIEALPPLSEAFNVLEGIPRQGELAAEMETGNAVVGKFLRRFFPATASQSTVNAVDSLSLLLRHGLKEDQGGRTIHSVPAVLFILFKLENAVQAYTNMLQQVYTTKISVGGKNSQFIRYKIRSGEFLPAEVFALITATKEAILTILRCYSDIVSEDMFPEDVVSTWKFYQNELVEVAN